MSTQRIVLDQEGMERLKHEIEVVEQRLDEIRSTRKELSYHSTNEGLSMTPDFARLSAEEHTLFLKLSDLQYTLNNATIINRPSEGIIGIGTTVRVIINDFPSELIKIVSFSPNVLEGEISVDSPLYKEIEGKQAGYVGSYHVGDSTITVKVLEVL